MVDPLIMHDFHVIHNIIVGCNENGVFICIQASWKLRGSRTVSSALVGLNSVTNESVGGGVSGNMQTRGRRSLIVARLSGLRWSGWLGGRPIVRSGTR